MAKRSAEGLNSSRWTGRNWSEWVRLDLAIQEKAIPSHPGVYRLRGGRFKGLLYVGESSDIRRRLQSLRRALEKAARGLRKNTGHWAAPNVYSRLRGKQPQVSWLKDSVSEKSERKGIECECIADHRRRLKRKPNCQFVSLVAE